ncbi:tetratricopeptide repeat protein [Paracoccus aminophilus]|uniref:Ancillary SecYEG translocon subunit/Cell division coordinator CpoB TPR domain-containing protein n=1 Tax=Paracoccus aminophilus JCM 7686 TaxID=1367847 RepID=S5Y1Y1_PARAH|nr:tetratricopeptide repeat protein [Paracoccus aminophilus]AGT09740.1 hypothetical protein JCM7686_2684 [Paracoccus aminophilus JCM 7686]
MANQNDSFIDEVTSELRRDRLFQGLRRFGWIVVLLIIALVVASGWYEYRKSQDRQTAQDWGDAVVAAQTAADPASALDAVDPAGSKGRRAISGLLAGGASADAGDAAKAVAELKAAAEAAGPKDPVLRDLALLKAVIVGGPAMGAAERDALLTDLSKPGAPFELLALEQKAVALVAANRHDDAITLIRQIQKKDGLSEDLRRRLSEIMVTLDAPAEPEAAAAGLPDAAAAPAAPNPASAEPAATTTN